MASTLGGVVAVRNLQGKTAVTTAAAASSNKSGSAVVVKKKSSPFTDRQFNVAWKSALLTSILSIVATNLQSSWASPLQMVFTMCLTVACYLGATRLPATYNAVVHPLVTSSLAFLVVLRTLAGVNGQTFLDVLKTYKTGSLHPMKAGAADYLFYILGPSVVSFAIAVYSRKTLLFQNLPMVLTAMLISSAGGLFATGAFVRLIHLGGQTGNAALIRLSLLARNVTTALALPLTEMMGGNMSIAAAAVCLTGILGASYGIPLLNALGVKDPICRGLGIGSSAQGLGVASMAGEPDALPFASVAMVLTAVAATTFASIPSFRHALVRTTVGTVAA
jgi:putative effector of murein hydrolase